MEKHDSSDYETLDYDKVSNAILREELAEKSHAVLTKENVARWVVTLLIGLGTGMFAFGIDRAVAAISEHKFSLGLRFLREGRFWAGFAAFTGLSVSLVTLSALIVAYGEPISGGSGIPEIKGYLNGTKVRRLLRIRTLVCKVVGVIFSVSGGLAVGKEGPLVHTGSIIAAHLSQGGKVFRYTRAWLRGMRNDHDKRDFISGGAAAGVAAAFGAPIGGVLFSLEEASSFWSLRLTWRTFFCSMVCSFTLNYFLSGSSGNLNKPGLITFGSVALHGYQLWELIPFVLLAVLGGMLGALFNWINITICRFRRARINASAPRRVAEAALIALATATCLYAIPYIATCRVTPDDSDPVAKYNPFTCSDGSFNDVATLFYAPQDTAIQSLFHNQSRFRPLALLAFSATYFCLAVVTYGSSVPSGLFVPSILVGASFGRLVGHAVRAVVPAGWVVTPASYALVGASSMLGGVCRMTISLTVILAETTNDTAFLFPIMLSLTISKWVGDLFNVSLYDLHVQLKEIPFLEPEPSDEMHYLVASDVMTHEPVCFDEVVQVGELVEVLRSNRHNGFPVLSRCRQGNGRTFAGLILRSQICFLLKYREFVPEDVRRTSYSGENSPARKGQGYLGRRGGGGGGGDRGNDEDAGERDREYLRGDGPHGSAGSAGAHWTSSNLKWIDFSTSFAALVPDIEDVTLSARDSSRLVDLRPYMHQSPFIVQEESPVSRCFTLFRTMGLRHLCVVDSHSELVGIITRHELEEHACEAVFHKVRERRRDERRSGGAAWGARKGVPGLARKGEESLLGGVERHAYRSYHTHGVWSAVAEFQRISERESVIFR